MKDLFVVDLNGVLDVRSYPVELIAEDMAYYNCSHPMQLNDYDWHVFEYQGQAENWLDRYKKAIVKFRKCPGKKKRSKKIPCMLYKEKYAAQTIMREKLSTIRHYLKPWQPGQEFYLQGRRNFLKVTLKSIEKIDEKYKYNFDL